MKKFYIQVNQDNIITDVLDFPYSNYVEYETDVLPVGVMGGWFKFENGEIIEITELNPNTIENQIKAAIDDFTMNLLEEGLL